MRLRSTLILLAVAAVIPLLALFAVSAWYVYGLENQAAVESESARVRVTLETIDAEIRGTADVLRALATSSALAADDYRSFWVESRIVLVTQPSWQNVVLSSVSGTQLSNANVVWGEPLPAKPVDPSSFDFSLHHDGPSVGDVTGGVLSNNGAGIAVRIPIKQNGKLQYVLTAVLRPAAFQRILDGQPLPPTSVMGLVGTNGRFIARIPPQPTDSPASNDYLNATKGSFEGWYRGKTVEGVDTYTAFSRSRLSQWSLGYGVPANLVAAGARRSVELLLIGLTLSAVIAVYLILGLARRIADPIDQVAKTAQSIGSDVPVPSVRSSIFEVQQLSESIRQTAESVAHRDLQLKQAYARSEAQAIELNEKNDNRNRFLALLSHELRNPLAPLRTGLELLKLLPPGSRRSQIEVMMERQISQMDRLIGDLLDVGRIERGQMELRIVPVNLAEVVENALHSVRHLIDSRDHEVKLNLPRVDVVASGDVVRLEQVIGNLLTNAAKYTPKGGTITVSISATIEQAILTIADTGIGFEPSDAERLFEMFSRLAGSEIEDTGGLGIGLTLAKQLVHLHGGTLAAHSHGPGTGALFTVSLPLALSRPSPVNRRPRAAVRPECHILIADDNVDAADSMAEFLQYQGTQVDVVYDGTQAIEYLREHRPDVVILDLNMPGAAGLEVATFLRRQDWAVGVVLIALTGMARKEDLSATQDAGFDAHLTKPADLDDVKELVMLDRPAARRWSAERRGQLET